MNMKFLQGIKYSWIYQPIPVVLFILKRALSVDITAVYIHRLS